MNTNAKKILRRLPHAVLGTALVAATVALALDQKSPSHDAPTAKPVSLTLDERPIDRNGRFPASFAPIVKKVSPSVVKVFTTTKGRTAWHSDGPGFEDPFFRWFFGPNRGERGLERGLPMPRQQGIGSGVIVTSDGYILTNNHVVDGADEVKVALQDEREFNTKVVGKDPKTDIAVLKVDAKDLPHLELADSDNLEVGDLVLAIGNPFGVGQTVTMGMVSAKGRGNLGLDYEDFIQTDAAINPGNSGGALVDAEGRLVGINTAILSRSGGNQGIGFAIPSSLAANIMESLVKEGRVTRGYLGVMIQDVTPALAKQFGLKTQSGALVGDVTSKSPAEKAGLQSGDVILEYNGKPVEGSRQLKLAVGQTKPGTEVPIKVIRDGAPRTIEVTLKELPGSQSLASREQPETEDTGTLNGVQVADLDNRLRRQFDVPEEVDGALITNLRPDSAASEAGLRPGDVILEINRKPVKSADDAVRLTERAKDKTTLVRVWREGASRYVVVDESEAG